MYLWIRLCRHVPTKRNALFELFEDTGDQSKQHRAIKFLLALVQHLLNHSYFHVGGSSVQTTLWCFSGVTAGPDSVFSCCIDSMRECIFAHVYPIYPTLLSQPYFSNHYVDNRLLLILSRVLLFNSFWNWTFTLLPFCWKWLTVKKLLDSLLILFKSTVTYVQPWEILKSWCLARLRPILNNVCPETVRRAQVQDFLALFHTIPPTLFTPTLKNEIAMLCQQCQCFMSHIQMFRYTSLKKKFALRGRRVCGNRYNKRLAVQFNILTSAGGARGTHWTGTNEDAGVYLWYQKGTPFWRTCAIGWNCCSSCCHSTFDASIIQAT